MLEDALYPITSIPDRDPLVTPLTDAVVQGDGAILAEQLRAKPEGIPEEAWLAMQGLSGRKTQPTTDAVPGSRSISGLSPAASARDTEVTKALLAASNRPRRRTGGRYIS